MSPPRSRTHSTAASGREPAGEPTQGPGAALGLVTVGATLFGVLVLVGGVTSSSLPASLTGVVIVAAVALALHRSTGGRAALVAGIVPWGMLLSVCLSAGVTATSFVNEQIPREGTGVILFLFVFLVLGAVGTCISTALAVWAWRRPALFLRLTRPVAAAVALLNLAMAVAGGARLARHPDAHGYPATLPAGVPVRDTDLMPPDDKGSLDFDPLRPTCQARWDAAHGVWALVDTGRLIAFVRPAKKGTLVSMHPSELDLAPPSASVGSALLCAALSALAAGGAWAARRGRKSHENERAPVSAAWAAVVASGGAAAITGGALLVYQIYLGG